MTDRRTALITGVTGQDGAYLAKTLLEKGYRVVGAFRRTSGSPTHRLAELGIAESVERVAFDFLELSNMIRVLERTKPDEIYNLGAQSFVGESFEQPIFTSEVTGLGAGRLLEAMRTVCPTARFFQASTSEMFGKVRETPQREETPFYPRSPYGVAKVFAHWMAVNYRESFGLRCSSGIMFNHESPLRGQEFVTRRITLGLARVKHGKQPVLELGNLNARRDWGFAGDYMRGAWRILQADEPGDYVLATGQSRSVRDFVQAAGEAMGFRLEFFGEGLDETAVDARSGRVVLRINPSHFRPAEVDALIGDPSKAERELGWTTATAFDGLVAMMAEADERRVVNGTVPF